MSAFDYFDYNEDPGGSWLHLKAGAIEAEWELECGNKCFERQQMPSARNAFQTWQQILLKLGNKSFLWQIVKATFFGQLKVVATQWVDVSEQIAQNKQDFWW